MIPYEQMMALEPRETVQTYDACDTILYALGVGAGLRPIHESLPFVYEEGLQALPTMAAALAWPGFWLKEPQYDVDWKRVLHGEHSIEIIEPLPSAGEVVGRLAIEEVYDKGPGKGALLHSRRDIVDRASGRLLAIERRTSFLRGDGGCGGSVRKPPSPHLLPEERPCDTSDDMTTAIDQALIYRLSGDFNPLHADPIVAESAGFERPILHGLSTYGAAGLSLLLKLCGGDASRFKRLDVRFTAPVYPGETIHTEIWKEGDGKASFRSKAKERDAVVLNNGYFEYR
ncbi:MaoC/PaaZ C-terminal domain-containing protein [Marinicaulis aureus]|uniref:MaoC/PaaZ C-terminal domain-containing protein n=1 Tax=Hyphococcus aureus TaxID=2666033 RepID=A0ABW1KY77_9PROT